MQEADPLIEASEGDAPAYRGTAYVVFEDLALVPIIIFLAALARMIDEGRIDEPGTARLAAV